MFDKEPKIKVDPKNKEKPFVLMNNIRYTSEKYDGLEVYSICINKGYNWNGANIPRFLWRLVGSQYDPMFLPASCVHDFLCENKDFIIQKGAKISSDIFRDILIETGVGKIKANIMSSAVYCYQLTQKGWN